MVCVCMYYRLLVPKLMLCVMLCTLTFKGAVLRVQLASAVSRLHFHVGCNLVKGFH